MTILRNDNRWQPSNITFDGKEILRYDKQQLTAEMRYIDYGLGVSAGGRLERMPRARLRLERDL